MPRGRPRKKHPSIPAHIDQEKLPRGLYWDPSGSGRWYVRESDPEGGRSRATTVAGKDARLSELHAIVEQRAGGDVRGTVGWVIARFEESTEFAALSLDTRTDYGYCANVAREYKTDKGRGPTLDKLYVDRLSLPSIQGVVEAIAKGRIASSPGAEDGVPNYPSKANHLLRFLRRLFPWGMRHGHCKTNPAQGAKEVKERKRSGMPLSTSYAAILKFARERGALKSHTKGSLSPLLWPMMEIKYLCRMRTVEVVALTDAHASKRGLYIARRKGSNDNIVRWSPRLRAAWDGAIAAREQILSRSSNVGRPFPADPRDRHIFINESCAPISASGLNSLWGFMMCAAIKAGVITASQRFTKHGLKHRGVTDTKGSRRRKQRASGHRTKQMVVLYDHDVPVVQPAMPRDEANFQENFQEAAIAASGEDRNSPDSNGKSGGPYRTRTYNQLIKSHIKR